MIEIKRSTTSKVQLKGLVVNGSTITDEEGVVKDLNKIVLAAFEDGEEFTFAIQSKTDDSSIIEEDGEADE